MPHALHLRLTPHLHPLQIDVEGRTAVIAAAYMGHASVVRALLSRSDIAVCSSTVDHSDVDCRTALTVAAMGVSEACVAALLDYGASVDHRDLDGESSKIP